MASKADSNIEAINALLKGIDIVVSSKVDNNSTLILTGTILEADRGENTYTVSINGNSYKDIPTLTDILDIGLTVKVIVPQGQYNQMFILGYIH